jgi:hypothetical protein
MNAISPADRDLIDRATASGAIQKIPMGVFGINAATDKPYPTVEAAIAAHEATVRKCATFRCAPMDERDRKIMECRRSGLSIRQTAAEMGMGLSVIHGRFRKLRPGARW